MPEIWKPIPGTLYAASNRGRIRGMRGAILRPGRMPGGHLSVAVQGVSRCVHELVLLAFVGPRPAGMEARHLNHVPSDNRLVNLEWNTRSRNTMDKKHDPNFKRSLTGYKLSADEARKIKQAVLAGAGVRKTARLFDISPAQVSNIKLGRQHRDV